MTKVTRHRIARSDATLATRVVVMTTALLEIKNSSADLSAAQATASLALLPQPELAQ